jgi:hypothetical protein
MSRLFGAELLKLRRRRGLVSATIALMVGPMLLAYAITSILHAVDPDEYGPAGGTENFNSSIEVLGLLGLVAAVIVGVMAGAGDLSAGVFRELVVTGRSRLSLFAVRLPGGLAFLLPIAAVAFALAAVAATALAGSEPVPGPGLIARQGGFLLLLLGFSFATALGVASVLWSRGIAIGLLLGWHLAAAPILLSTGKLDSVLPNAALDRLQPAFENGPAISAAGAAATLALWTAATVVAGAWRTATREA